MRFGSGELIVNTILLLIFVGFIVFSPGMYGYLLMEDMPPEWFGFFLLLWGSWLWGKGAVGRYRSGARLGSLFCLGLAIFSFFVAGEEISWGQRIIQFKPPEYFEYRNVQRELTFHNIQHSLIRPREMAMLFMMVYGVAFPFCARFVRPFRRFVERERIPVPSLGAALGFCLAIWLMTSPITATDDEAGEVFFAFGLCAAGLSAAGVTSRLGARFPLKAMAIIAIISLVATALSFLSSEHRDHLYNVGHLQAAMAYQGRGMILEAAGEYEQLARYWETHWELWIQVIDMYYRGGNLDKAQALALDFLRVNKREGRVFEILAEIGWRTGQHETAEMAIREVLIDEPYNNYAHMALQILQGRRWLYEEPEQLVGSG